MVINTIFNPTPSKTAIIQTKTFKISEGAINRFSMIKKHLSPKKVVNIAAILVTIASLMAAVCWITSGRAGGEASERKTAALGFMMLRLEAATEASTARVEQQTYLTQAAMYWAYAGAATDNETKSALENLGNTSYTMSTLKESAAENAENRAEKYYDAYEGAMGASTVFGRQADSRSTGALIFNISAIIASLAVLFRRKEILYVYLPIFMIGVIYFVLSVI